MCRGPFALRTKTVGVEIGKAIAAMNGLHEQVDDSVSSQRLLKKATEDEVIEDEFNIHSTVGLVSALLLSCLASTVSDSKDLKDFAEERDRRWELQDDGVSIFDVYQALIFVSMSCSLACTGLRFFQSVLPRVSDSGHGCSISRLHSD